MEVGIDSFASVRTSENGETADATQSVAELLERIEQADRSGLDIFGIGEHHRHEFLDSANAVILAAAAARTERIRLTSAVTVLSAADPVRDAACSARPAGRAGVDRSSRNETDTQESG